MLISIFADSIFFVILSSKILSYKNLVSFWTLIFNVFFCLQHK